MKKYLINLLIVLSLLYIGITISMLFYVDSDFLKTGLVIFVCGVAYAWPSFLLIAGYMTTKDGKENT